MPGRYARGQVAARGAVAKLRWGSGPPSLFGFACYMGKSLDFAVSDADSHGRSRLVLIQD